MEGNQHFQYGCRMDGLDRWQGSKGIMIGRRLGDKKSRWHHFAPPGVGSAEPAVEY